MIDTVQFVALLLLGYLAYCDLRSMTIPNKIVWPALFMGAVYYFYCGASNAFWVVVTIIFLFASGCIGASGWGDVKVAMFAVLMFGWQHALISYVLAQIVFMLFYLLTQPQQFCKEFFCRHQAEKKERPFVPFFMIAILAVLLLGRFFV